MNNNAIDNTDNETEDQATKIYTSAPYIKGISEKTARIFKNYNIQLCHKPTKTLRSVLCHMKDRREVEDQAGVVYKLNCLDCSKCYVGESGRLLRERRDEHKKDVTRKNERSNVYHHVRDTGHSFDFQGIKILDREEKRKPRKNLESVHTKLNNNTINRFIELSDVYIPIINSLST